MAVDTPAAGVIVAARSFDFTDNKQFIAEIYETSAYFSLPSEWEQIFEDLAEADRNETRATVLEAALRLSGHEPRETLLLAITYLRLRGRQGHDVVNLAERVIFSPSAERYEWTPELCELRGILFMMEDDALHRPAYLKDLVDLIETIAKGHDN